ncbi:MAG: NAD(P)-binding domain-containing protein [Actinomycetota bacterium]|nr:NAD(P)-binding domain-containing protein [Actinomycetota bacterium]
MRIGLLGTGVVGRTLGLALVGLGHEVRMGSRTAGHERALAWVAQAGEGASEGDFADAASFGELVINATAGAASLDALHAAGAEQLEGKVLVDVANPLDFSAGMPPTLTVCNDDSLGERIQRAFGEARVVKALNTVNAEVMVDPGRVPGRHTVFVCGNDPVANAQVGELLRGFGWPAESILDLGDITAARGVEMYLPLWLRLFSATGTPHVNVEVHAAAAGPP